MSINPKIQVLVKYEDFTSYNESHGTNKLDENSVIWSKTKSKMFMSMIFPINEEIFDGIETKYNISKNDDNYLISFKSKSDVEYRFDILNEVGTDIYHLGFSLSSSDKYNYEDITDKNEALDVFNRLIWILNDIRKEICISRFIIGITTDEKKNRIYQYMLRSIPGWKKIESSYYDTGECIYFEL